MNPEQSNQRRGAVACLAPAHGYEVEGDRVRLRASIEPAARARSESWSLQLWATRSAPRGRDLKELRELGQLVASGVVSSASSQPVELCVDARLPLTGWAYCMTLVLVGSGERVVDLSVYPVLQTFPAPRLLGGVGYAIDGDRIELRVDRIESARPADNRSGTLSLELWAVDPACPDPDAGHQLAAAELPPLNGQCHFASVARTVAFAEPPAGRHELALRLREWTPSGYATRDVRTFALAYERAPARPSSAPRQRTAVAVSAARSRSAAKGARAFSLPPKRRPVGAAPVAPTPRPSAAARASARTPKRHPGESSRDALAMLDAPAGRAGSSAPPSERRALPGARRLSIQHASVEELAGVEGLNRKLAREIVRARPFASLDELARVRGMEAGLLRRLRAWLEP